MVLKLKRDSSLFKGAMVNIAKFILLHIALNGSYCKVWQFHFTKFNGDCYEVRQFVLFPNAKVVIA